MTAADLVAAYVFGQRFRYLRLSVTEVCNFRCTYCLPEGYRKSETVNFLSVDEAARLVSAFAGLGVGKVRLTGGEPTVRRDLTKLISRIAIQPGIDKVALTTNGWNLRRNVAEWSRAGLTHLNVSIDSLDRSVFAAITGHDRLPDVLAGLDVAQDLPLKSVKVNAVLLRDCLEQGFSAWTEFVRQRSISVRFIELMRPSTSALWPWTLRRASASVNTWMLSCPSRSCCCWRIARAISPSDTSSGRIASSRNFERGRMAWGRACAADVGLAGGGSLVQLARAIAAAAEGHHRPRQRGDQFGHARDLLG